MTIEALQTELHLNLWMSMATAALQIEKLSFKFVEVSDNRDFED